MSRSDLDRIQAQLKVAIQSHQIVVTKMKNDPQNGGLQKQLHDLQAEITSLSERQKSIVQLLRKELVSKSPIQVAQPAHQNYTNTQICSPPIRNLSPSLLPPQTVPTNLSTKPNGGASYSVANTTTIAMVTPTIHSPTIHTPSTGHHNRPRMPIVPRLVTQIAPRSSSPPIKVPQYTVQQRPSILQGGRKPQLIRSRETTPEVVQPPVKKPTYEPLPNPKLASLEKKSLTPEERKKLEFFAALDLITPDTVKEIQSKRSERKRRSTANPQFSYGNFEPESDIHEDYCAVCFRSGELLMCDTCSLVYHLPCLDPPLTAVPQGLWSCPKCVVCISALTSAIKTSPTSENPLKDNVALIHSYLTAKTAKEEEKKKLERKCQELAGEKELLEKKAKQLSQVIMNHINQQTDLSMNSKTLQHSVDRLKTFVKFFQST